MDKKQVIITAVLVVMVGVGSFLGGMKYAQGQRSAQFAARAVGQGGLAGSSSRIGGNAGQRGAGAVSQNGAAGNFAGGQITAKDDTSVTIKTRNGGSQIVFFSPSTTVDKSVSGATADLAVGQQIMADGKNNPDGSLAATSIQIRPDTPQGQGAQQ